MENNGPPMSEKQLKWIEWMVDTRFDCDFWVLPGLKKIIMNLLKQIRCLEEIQ